MHRLWKSYSPSLYFHGQRGLKPGRGFVEQQRKSWDNRMCFFQKQGVPGWRHGPAGGSNPTVTNCTFSENSGVVGGGMFNDSSSPRVIGCTFAGNQSSSDTGTSWGGWNGELVKFSRTGELYLRG